MKVTNTNLRRDGDVRVPADVPVADSAFAGWKPLGIAGGLILACKGSALALNDTEESVDLGSKILCGVRNGDDRFIVMTEDGPAEVTAESDVLSVRKLYGDYPAVVLKAVKANPQSADVGAREVSVSGGRIRTSDERQVCADYNAAYLRLCALAAGTGSAIQPALCRYRLVGEDGTELFVSPPVLLSPEGGTQFGDYFPLYSADGKSISGYTLTAKTWKLGLSCPADTAAAKSVARLDVMMTPLFHPYDERLPSPAVYGRYASSSDVFMRVALPGRQAGLSQSFPGNAEKILMKSVAWFDGLATCVASVHNPFASSKELVLDVAPSASPSTDVRKIQSVTAKAVRRSDSLVPQLRPPHGFTASNGACGAGVALWSNVRQLRYKGAPAETMAAGPVSAQPWTATVAVSFRDGSHVTRTSGASTGAFTAVAPLLCYPSGDATAMVVQIVSGNVVRRGSFTLTPDPSGRFSVYISPAMEPVALGIAGNGQVFDEGMTTKAVPSAAVFTPAGAPADVRLTATLPAPATALCATTGSGQSWEFGRERFVVGTASRLLSVVTGAGLKSCSMRTICESGVCRPDGICSDGRGGFFAVTQQSCTLDFGPLVHIGPGGRAELFDDSFRYYAVARDGSCDELWALVAAGEVLVFERCSRDFVSRRGVRSVRSFVQTGDDGVAVSADGAMILHRQKVRGETQVEVSEVIVPAKYELAEVASVRVDFQASSFDGEIKAEGLNTGDMRPWLIAKCRLEGAVAGPVVLPLIGRRLRALRVSMTGTASADMQLRGMTVKPVPALGRHGAAHQS